MSLNHFITKISLLCCMHHMDPFTSGYKITYYVSSAGTNLKPLSLQFPAINFDPDIPSISTGVQQNAPCIPFKIFFHAYFKTFGNMYLYINDIYHKPPE